MDFGIRGKVAFVAAASSGLGKAVALELASEGVRVAINSRRPEEMSRVGEEISAATGADLLELVGDVTNEADVQKIAAETVSKFGSLDILVTNAGGPPAGFFEDFTAQHYRDAVELNLISTINLCRASVPHMRERGWGR